MKALDMSSKIVIALPEIPQEPKLPLPISPTDSESPAMGGVYSGRTATPLFRKVSDPKVNEPGLKLLETQKCLFIKRKVQSSWFGSTLVTHNIYPWVPKKEYIKGTKIMKSYEKIPFCRFSVGPHDTEVTYKSKKDVMLDDSLFLQFERRDECNLFCQNRQPLNVNLIYDYNVTNVGSVIQHSDCCECREWKFDIIDSIGEIRYTLRQDSYRAKSMHIEDFGGKKLGIVNYARKSSCFAVQFPKKASSADKALIIAAVLEVSHTAYDKRWK